MIARFEGFIKNENLFGLNSRILLAVSGGIDSIAMCNLFNKAGYKFGIAHCNFKLRGKESDEDESFVRKVALKYKVNFYVTHFATEHFAQNKSISVQMAARTLRYNWLETIAEQNNYQCIATAHHQNDVVETVLLNLIRGTGIAGLHGILPRRDTIVRPLLFATKEEITEYVQMQRLQFREDSSNKSTKYIRNKLRNEVIPVLKTINPSLEETITQNINRVRNIENIFRQVIEKAKTDLIEKDVNETSISIEKLKKLRPIEVYLYEILSDFNFSGSVVKDILDSLDSQSGKLFYSSTHRLVKDRSKLIISKILPEQQELYLIPESLSHFENSSIRLNFAKIENNNFKILSNDKVACLDISKLLFPLTLRKWKNGDYFYPLGMTKKKKLSNFFIDNKIPINEKENVWVLTSVNNIAWVVGYRIDNRYKVTLNTKNILKINFLRC